MPLNHAQERGELGFGDLKQICEAAPESAQASRVLDCFQEAVVASHAAKSHAGTGGLSVQLPDPVARFEASGRLQGKGWRRRGLVGVEGAGRPGTTLSLPPGNEHLLACDLAAPSACGIP